MCSNGSLLKNISKFIQYILPPKEWRVWVIVLLGILVGLLGLIAKLSNATSYLSDDPEACVNCHIMQPQYATWARGSHGRVATCNDCHVPHDNVVKKYFFKAKDGSRHAFMFTFHMEPQVIRVHEEGEKVIQENCIRCHSALFNGLVQSESVARNAARQDLALKRLHTTDQKCWSCHRETPHGRMSGLSTTPNVLHPELQPIVPNWVKQFILQAQLLEQDHKSRDSH